MGEKKKTTEGNVLQCWDCSVSQHFSVCHTGDGCIWVHSRRSITLQSKLIEKCSSMSAIRQHSASADNVARGKKVNSGWTLSKMFLWLAQKYSISSSQNSHFHCDKTTASNKLMIPANRSAGRNLTYHKPIKKNIFVAKIFQGFKRVLFECSSSKPLTLFTMTGNTNSGLLVSLLWESNYREGLNEIGLNH